MTNDENLEDYLDQIATAIKILKTVPKKVLKTPEYSDLDFEQQDDVLWALERVHKAGNTAEDSFYETINRLL